MDLNSGYKQTEVGLIPEDWKQTKTCSIASTVRNAIVGGPFGSDLVSLDYVDDGVPVIRGQNMSSRWVSGNFVFVSPAKAKSLEANLARPGDLVFTQRGSLGQVSLVPESPFERYLVSQSQMKLSVNRAIADPLFFYFVFTSEDQQKLIRQETIQTGVPHINLGILRDLPVQLPPLAEQEAIAEALSNADALIESLQSLITKKCQIKQGAMQELLTGKRRLPRFRGDWETKAFAELFDFSGGLSASRDQLSSEGHCYLHYGDIHKSSKTFINVRTEYQEIPKLNIALKEVPAASLLDDGDVVFVDASEDDDGASKHVVIINEDKIPYIAGLHTIVAKSKNESLDHDYRRYCFQTREVKRQFYYYAVGTKVTGISKTNIPKLVLSVPPLDEQAAIAAVLTGMDSEIAALEVKLVKYRQLKQGMMHNLLSGKIRLCTPALAEVKPAPTREEGTATASGSGFHTWAFNEAVIISVLADQFGKPEFPLGRKRRTKLSYLFHRKTDQDVQGYLKKAAGPYNPRAKYAGPEKIAQENGYVRNHQSDKFNGFIAAEKIAQAKTYFAKWYDPKITAWLEQFRFKSNDELECLATVDMAMQELFKQDKKADVDSVRALIASEPDWLPKLDRSAFSDSGIADAIAQCRALFG